MTVMTSRVVRVWTGRRAEWQWIRFLCVGVLNTMVGYGVFLGMLGIGIGAFPALLVAFTAGVGFNFLTARALVFRSAQRGRLPRFALVYVGLFLVNWAALSLVRGCGVPDWAAQGLLTLPLAMLSFIAQKRLVFWHEGTNNG